MDKADEVLDSDRVNFVFAAAARATVVLVSIPGKICAGMVAG